MLVDSNTLRSFVQPPTSTAVQRSNGAHTQRDVSVLGLILQENDASHAYDDETHRVLRATAVSDNGSDPLNCWKANKQRVTTITAAARNISSAQ